ncbi:CATRA system-associated protein [Nocardia thailandica]
MDNPSGTGSHSGLDEETRADLIEVLQDLTVWQLPPVRWEQIVATIDELASFLSIGDGAGARSALVELELLGPVRARRIGTSERVSITEPVRTRAARLVHALTVDRLDVGTPVQEDSVGRAEDLR